MDEMTEEKFREQNPQLTPEVMAKFRFNWKRIFKIEARQKKLIQNILKIEEERKNAMLMNDFDKQDEMSTEIWELAQTGSALQNDKKILYEQIGANRFYPFELN